MQFSKIKSDVWLGARSKPFRFHLDLAFGVSAATSSGMAES